MSNDLCERLRSDADNIGHSDRTIYPCGSLLDAAAEIERLTAENKRLDRHFNAATTGQIVAALHARAEAAEARLREAEEALRPFARVRIWPDSNDSATVRVVRPINAAERQARIKEGRPDLGEGAQEIVSFDGLTLGDFRKAAEAYQALQSIQEQPND